jgi:hypothetical protein
MYKKELTTNNILNNGLASAYKSYPLGFQPAVPMSESEMHSSETGLYGLNISGEYIPAIDQVSWKIDAKKIETSFWHLGYKPKDAVALDFAQFSSYEMGVRLAVETKLQITSYPSPEIPYEIGCDEPNIVFNFPDTHVLLDEEYYKISRELLSYEELDREIKPLPALETEVLDITLNNETACVGSGLKMGATDSRNPYPGLFLGVNVLFDSKTGSILHVETSDKVCNNWFQTPYQVIIYPCVPMCCPAVTIAISLWMTYIPHPDGGWSL